MTKTFSAVTDEISSGLYHTGGRNLQQNTKENWSPDILVKSNPSFSSFSHLARPGGALISPVCWKKWYGFTWTRLGAKFHTSSLSSMIHTKLSPQGKRALSRAEKKHLDPALNLSEVERKAKLRANKNSLLTIC